MLDADLLRSFVAIADSGSFTRAGVLVGRTQAAISMQIKKLEEAVGKPLLVREAKGIRLTPEGQYLLPNARRILRLGEETMAALRQPDLVGSIKIGIPDDYAVRYLPPILHRFAQSHPHVQIEVVCEQSVNLVNLLQERKLDLSILTAGYELGDSLIVREEPFLWMTSARHFAHEETPLPLAIFPHCHVHRHSMARLDEKKIDYRIAFTSPHTGGIQAAILAGLAVAALAKSSVLPGMVEVDPQVGLPPAPLTRIALAVAEGERREVVARMVDHIVIALRDLDQDPYPFLANVA